MTASKSETIIPVSCIKRGRWSYRGLRGSEGERRRDLIRGDCGRNEAYSGQSGALPYGR